MIDGGPVEEEADLVRVRVGVGVRVRVRARARVSPGCSGRRC